MMLKIVLCFVFILFMLPSGRCDSLDIDNKRCFNAQIQEALLILVDKQEVLRAIVFDTINDTTAVKQRFHIDYFHPKSKTWTSYQEDRRTMFYTLPAAKKSSTIYFSDRFVAKSLRVSLKKTDAVSWLGEICVQIWLLNVEYWPGVITSCEKGFYGDGKFCIDINECADTTGNFCPPRQHCIDSPGTYTCPGTCLENKLPNKRTGVCEDHCYHNGYLCHPRARCLYGKCICASGYEGDGSYCLDSCTAKGFTCDANANCADGKCKCRDGFNGNGEICQAICHFNLKLCHPSAVCRANTCKCKPGYVGDGISKCIFSRKLYELEMKQQRMAQTRLDIVETDVFEKFIVFTVNEHQNISIAGLNHQAGYATGCIKD